MATTSVSEVLKQMEHERIISEALAHASPQEHEAISAAWCDEQAKNMSTGFWA